MIDMDSSISFVGSKTLKSVSIREKTAHAEKRESTEVELNAVSAETLERDVPST